MTTEQIIVLGIAVALLLCPFALIFSIYKLLDAKSGLNIAQSSLNETRITLTRANETLKSELAQVKETHQKASAKITDLETERESLVDIFTKVKKRYLPIWTSTRKRHRSVRLSTC